MGFRINKYNFRKYLEIYWYMKPKSEFIKYFIKRLFNVKNLKFDNDVSMEYDGLIFNCGRFMDNCNIAHPHYEEKSINFVLSHSKGVFLDVGCNIGHFSILARKSRHKIISIDGNDDTMKLFEENIKLNSCEDIEHYCCVCLDKKKKVTFYKNPDMPGNSSVIYKNEDPVIVESNTIDNLLGLRKIDLVKIDAERAEYQVLKGMKKIIEAFRPDIIFESSIKKDFENDKEFLIKFGYNILNNGENFIASCKMDSFKEKDLWREKMNKILQNKDFNKE